MWSKKFSAILSILFVLQIFVIPASVSAVDGTGKESSQSSKEKIVVPRNAALPPSHVKAVNMDGVITVTWVPSDNAVSYKVYRGPDKNGPYTQIGADLSAGTQRFVDKEFEDNIVASRTNMYYAVSAVDGFGKESKMSSIQAATLKPPAPPKTFTAIIDAGSVALSWSSVEKAASYKLFLSDKGPKDFAPFATVTGNTYSYPLSDTTFDRSEKYDFAIAAIDAEGNESGLLKKAEVTVPKNTASVPFRVKAYNHDNKITVTWLPAKNASNYVIYRSSSKAGNYEKAGSASGTTFADEYFMQWTIPAKTNVYYKVAAVNAYGTESTKSAAAAVTVKPADGPDQFTAVSEPEGVRLKWSPVLGATGYQLYRASVSDSVYRPLTNEPLTSTTYLDPIDPQSVPTDTTYSYAVSWLDKDNHESMLSTKASVTVKAGSVQAPSEVQAQVNADDSVALTWTASPNAAGYRVYRSGGSQGGSVLVSGADPLSATVFTDLAFVGTNRDTDTSFEYTVTAINHNALESPKSTPARIVFPPSNNLLINPGFEVLDSAGKPGNWVTLIDTAAGAVQAVDQPAYQGGHSVKMTASNMASGSSVMMYQVIQVQPNRPFDYSGWFNTTGLIQAKLQLYIDFYDSGFNWVGNSVVDNTDASINGFVKLHNRGLVPANAAFANVFAVLRATGGGGAGTVFADSLSFRYSETQMLTAQPSTLSLEAGSSQKITVQAELSDGTLVDVTTNASFTPEDPSIAIMDKVSILALKTGSTKINVSFDGKNAVIDVSVTDKSLIRNGSFESFGGTEMADQWILLAGSPDMSVKLVGQPVYDGSRAMQMSGSHLQAGSSVMMYQVVPVQSGRPILYNGQINAVTLNNAQFELYIDYYDSSFTWVGNQVAKLTQPTQGYAALQNPGIVPINAAYANVFALIRSNADDASGEVYVDGLKFVELAVNDLSVTPNPVRVEQGKSADVTVNAVLSNGITLDVSTLALFTSGSSAIVATSGNRLTGVIEGETAVTVQFGGKSVNVPMVVSAPNFLVNPGFESGTDIDSLKGWSTYIDSDGAPLGSVQTVSGNAFDGNRSLQLSGQRLKAGSMVSAYQVIPVQANQTFAFSGKVNLVRNDKAKAELYVDFYDSSFHWLANNVVANDQPTQGYTSLSNNGIVPSGAAYANVFVTLRGTSDGGSGEIYADNLVWTYPKLTRLELNPAEMSLLPSQSQNVQILAVYSNGYTADVTQQAVFAQTDAQMISIQSGVVTANFAGTTNVVVSYGGLTSNLIIHVQEMSLLQNGGFEQYSGTNGVADGWKSYVDASDGMTAEFESVTSAVYASEGSRSQRINAINMQAGRSVMLYQVVNVKPNLSYDFNGYVRVDSLKKAVVQLYIDFYDANFQWVGNNIVDVTQESGNFVNVQNIGNVPQNAKFANLFIVLRATGDGAFGTVYADNFSYVQKRGS